MPNQTPIPTQINIAPSGMTWKNWKLVHGTDGFTTRETMEKYLCNPDRVRDLEECRDLNHRTIMQLDALIQLYEAQMEAVGAGGVEPLRKCNKLHQIAEPAAPVGKPIEDAIDALVMAAFTEGGCSEHRMLEARIQTELRKKELRTLLSTPQPCSRSHPHEEMTPMCELRTEIARLTNALARAEAAAPQAVQAAVPLFWVRLLRDGLYEGPVHNNSVGGKMLRDEKPGEWHPLYLHAAPAHPAEGVPAQANRDAVIQHLTNAGVLEHDGCGVFIASGDASELIDACMTLPLSTHPTQQGLEPTMFWDADDPERCESSINNVVVEVDNCRGLRVGDIVTIQRAVRLPNLEVRITQCPDAEGNGDLEWDEVVAAQAKQGGV